MSTELQTQSTTSPAAQTDAIKAVRASGGSEINLTYAEAARRLGVSVISLRRWVAMGRLRVRRFSATLVRIPADEIERIEREALA